MPHVNKAQVMQVNRFHAGLYTYRNPLVVPVKNMGGNMVPMIDALADGLNMEITNRMTIRRRPGFSLSNPNPIDGEIYWFYAFKPANFPGQIYHLVDSSTGIDYFKPETEDPPKRLVEKTSPTPTTFAQMGAYCFMANSQFAVKWDGPPGLQGITAWGIDAAVNPVGPNAHADQANFGSQDPDPEQPLWAANSVTVPAPPPNQIRTSQYIWFWNYGFNFVTGGVGLRQISGIQVLLEGVTWEGEGDISLNVRMIKSGHFAGVTRNVKLPARSHTIALGGGSELWGTSWTPNDLNQFDFGVGVQGVNGSREPATFSLARAKLAVFYLVPPDVRAITGPLNPQTGYHYVYCYGNSYSDDVSSPSPPSFCQDPYDPSGAGNIIASGIEILVNPSPDRQVTSIHIFRTTDGGGTPYFELPNSPVDNKPESDGRVHIRDTAEDNELQIDSIAPDPHFNDPPPQACIDPVWFAGRFWMHRDNNLFFASGPDTPQGSGTGAWNPVYVFALPEQIVRKFPTPNGLLIVSLGNLYMVRGISTSTFTITEFMKDVGIRIWTAGATDGPNIYLYTSDRQMLLLNANGIIPMATPIADKIDLIDPTRACVSLFRHTGLLNQLYISDGTTYLYSLNVEVQAWGTPELPTGGVSAIASIEVTPGIWQLWRAKPGSQSNITYHDWNNFTDEGIAYPCFLTFGVIPLADFLLLAKISDIVLVRTRTGTRVKLSVMANEISPIAQKQFQILDSSSPEPPELEESLSYRADRYAWMTSPLADEVNLILFRVDFDAAGTPDEIYTWTLGGSQPAGAAGPPVSIPALARQRR